MPTYSYICKGCKKSFSLMMSVRDHDKNKIACPKCKSKKVEQQYAAFFAVSAKKS